MTADVCDWDPFRGSYLQFELTLPFYILFQLILLGNTTYFEWKHIQKHTKDVAEMNSKFLLRLTYIVVQLTGLYFTTMELFRFVIGPYTLIFHRNILCDISAYSPKLINVVFYGCYGCHILLRLQLALKGSTLYLHKYTIICLSCVTLIPLICLPIIIIALSPSACIWKWTPMDIYGINEKRFSFCAFPNDGMINIFIIGTVYAVLINIIFSVVFSVKLKNVLSKNEDDKQTNSPKNKMLKSLMIKYSELTFVGCISTLINYILYFVLSSIVGIGSFLLYMDICLHCLMLALMHNYNETYYKQICNSCILKCFIDTSLNKQELNMVVIQKPPETETAVEADTNGVNESNNSNHSNEPELELEEKNGFNQEELTVEVKNIGNETRLKIVLTNNNSIVVPTGSEIHLTPPPVIDDDYEYDDDQRRESMRTTLSDAQIVAALRPIQKGVKRFIDNETGVWSPIQYKYKSDNTSILKPKKSATTLAAINPTTCTNKEKPKKLKKNAKSI